MRDLGRGDEEPSKSLIWVTAPMPQESADAERLREGSKVTTIE